MIRLTRKGLIMLIMAFLFSCNSEDTVTLNPTELEVTVLDGSGNPVQNAEVRLYRNQRDWEGLVREVDVQQTGADGVARFEGLLPVNYYFYAYYERNNLVYSNQFYDESFGGIDGNNYDLADFLTENAITRVTVSAFQEHQPFYDSVRVVGAQLFYREQLDFLDPEEDTLALNMVAMQNYDFLFDVSAQPGNVLDFGSQEVFFDEDPRDIGNSLDFFFFNSEYVSIDDILDESIVYSINWFRSDEFENLIEPNEQYLGVNISDPLWFNTPIADPDNVLYPLRLPDAVFGFNYGDDDYAVDLILEWK